MGRLKDWFFEHFSMRKATISYDGILLGLRFCCKGRKQNEVIGKSGMKNHEMKWQVISEYLPDLADDDLEILLHDKIIRNDVEGCRQILIRGFNPNQPFCTKHKVAQSTGGLVMTRVETHYLHLAIIYRRPAIVKVLLEAGASPLTLDSSGRCPLQIAVTYWPRTRYSDPFTLINATDDENERYKKYLENQQMISEKISNLLIYHGAKADVLCANDGDSLLHLAAKYNAIGCVKHLLFHGCAVNCTNTKGQTPLIISLIRGHLEVSKLLLAQESDANTTDHDGRTALHYACQVGTYFDANIVRLILSQGAEVNHRDKDGNTALHLATMEGNAVAISILITNNADADIINHSGRSALSLQPEHPQIYPGLIDAINILKQWSLYSKLTDLRRESSDDENTHSGYALDSNQLTPPTLQDIALHMTRRCLGYARVVQGVEKQQDWPYGLKQLISLS